MDIHPVTTLAQLEAYQQVTEAVFAHDFVDLPADPIGELVPVLEGKAEAGELVQLHVGFDDGVPVGLVFLSVTTLDNLECANLDISVHPDHRRRGLGRQLLDHGLDQVRAHGRTRVFFFVPSQLDRGGSKPRAVLESLGAKPALEEVRRRLDLTAHPVGPQLAAPVGYHVEQWVDHCPDHLVDGAAYLLGRMVLDAPMGTMDYEQEKWDAARYRDKEASTRARGRTRVCTAVVHDQTGTVAGTTEIGVNAGRPEHAYQWDTIVDPDHRGHRLGMVLKTWNHQLLAERVPGVRSISTWNADTNTFMISVNEELGFEPMELWTEWQLDL
jgi:GNAT superfamily N-acetyltransferase